MPRWRVPLIADIAYHVYNRGNNRQALLFEPRDYAEFMRRIRHFLLGDHQDGIGTVERGPWRIRHRVLPDAQPLPPSA
jgi:hypothetical protein